MLALWQAVDAVGRKIFPVGIHKYNFPFHRSVSAAVSRCF